MEIIKRQKRNGEHVYIPELKDLYRQGRISRREFLRNATLLARCEDLRMRQIEANFGFSPLGLTGQIEDDYAQAFREYGIDLDNVADNVTIVDASAGKVQYDFQNVDVDTAGTYYAYFILNDSDGQETLPAIAGGFRVKIYSTT